MTTEQPLQVSEIYNRLWGYEKPDIKPVLNEIFTERPEYKLKKAYILKLPDGSRYTYTCDYYKSTSHYNLTNFLNDKRETNYLYKYYEEGQEEEVNEFKMFKKNIVRTYYAIPYEKSYFKVGKRYKDYYDEYYTIIRKTKNFLTLQNCFGSNFRVKYEEYYEGEKLLRIDKLNSDFNSYYAKNWID